MKESPAYRQIDCQADRRKEEGYKNGSQGSNVGSNLNRKGRFRE